MTENIQSVIKDFLSSLQTARLYPEWHPEFKKAVDKAFQALNEALSERQDLIIGIIGEELAFEKEIFFELSKFARPMVLYLKGRGIEKIQIQRGLEFEELSKFFSLLVGAKEEIKEPQELLESLGIRNISAGKITVSSECFALPDKDKTLTGLLDIYEKSADDVSDCIEHILNERDIDYLVLKLTMKNVMENLLGFHQEFLRLATIKRYDSKTFYHILNVSILSMYFAAKLGFAKEKVLEIGTAALFHDIGKLYISRKIIQKPGRLTDEEFGKIKSHVVMGTEILLRYVDTMGILPAVVCFEHHLKYNLKGYPKVSHYEKLHIASQIVALCDIYDALSHKRSYKSDYPPNMIYELMVSEKGASFESGLIDRFFRIIGVWPLGTIVLLTDKRIAVVRKEHEDDIFSPEVEVISPAEKKEAIDLRKTEGVKIERFLNPFREGKQYLHLVYPSYGNELTSP